MEKVIVVGYARDDETPLTRTALAAACERLLTDLDPARFPGLSLQVEDHDATAQWQRRTRPLARRVAACLAVWTEDGDALAALDPIGNDLWPDRAACVVTETVPRWDTLRTIDVVEPQPGVLVTSLLYRKPGLTTDQFVAHWRDVHQPMSLRIHPQHTYVRNLVTRAQRPATPQFDAICEEGFAEVDDVLDPSRFFGGDLRDATWQENSRTIGDDVPLFLDTDHTTATIMREYRLRDIRARES